MEQNSSNTWRRFKPFLHIGLKNVEEHQVCSAAVNCVGDICRALTSQVTPYCNEIMSILLETLQNQNVNRQVKPQVLSVFGDIALAIGVEFKPYLEMVLQMLMQASRAQVDRSDYDWIDYLNELREGCLEAYSGILNGLKGDSKVINSPDLVGMHPHLAYIVEFLCVIEQDIDKTEDALCAAIGLVG